MSDRSDPSVRTRSIELRAAVVVCATSALTLGILLAVDHVAEARSVAAVRAEARARAEDSARMAVERWSVRIDRALAGVVDGRGAEDVAKLVGVDVLDRVDAEGRVVASYDWPESRGLRAIPRPPCVEPCALAIDRPAGPRDVWLASRQLDFGGFAQVAVELDRLARTAAELAGAEARVTRKRPDGDLEAGVAVALEGAEGRTSHWLVVDPAVRGAVRAIRDGHRRERVAAGLVFAVVALLSPWIARVLLQPVAQGLRALHGIARGEEDHDVVSARGDPFGAVAASFSRSRRRAERTAERARAAERVAAWRDTARRLAHELKNPLVPIRLTMSNLVKAKRSAPEAFEEIFDSGAAAVGEEVERLRRIVDEFSAYAKLPEPRPVLANVDALVDSVVGLYAGGTVAVERRSAGAIGEMGFDPDLLAQALKNLVGNAVEAASREVVVATWVDDREVVIEVVDDGPGFGEVADGRAFDPSFTTKPGGSGLGLAITYRIVAEHGGAIDLGDVEGGGGRVEVRLPRGGLRTGGEA